MTEAFWRLMHGETKWDRRLQASLLCTVVMVSFAVLRHI